MVSDQEAAVTRDLISRACEAYGIDRDFSRSEGHTRTRVAAREIRLVKLGALKLLHQTQKQGLRLTQDEGVVEAAQATLSSCSQHCFAESGTFRLKLEICMLERIKVFL
jgi:hypothetical protein